MKDPDGPNKWLVTATVVCGTLCIGVTISMMNLAVPLMISDLQTDIDTIQWIITGPMLVGSREAPTTATDAGRKSSRSEAVVNRRSSNSERATLASVGKTEKER